MLIKIIVMIFAIIEQPWAMVAIVDNASRIRKSFMNGIIVVKTNPILHTLKPHSSHVENLRSV